MCIYYILVFSTTKKAEIPKRGKSAFLLCKSVFSVREKSAFKKEAAMLTTIELADLAV